MSGAPWSGRADRLLSLLLSTLEDSGLTVLGVVTVREPGTGRALPRVEFSNPDGSLGHAGVTGEGHRRFDGEVLFRLERGETRVLTSTEGLREELGRAYAASSEATNDELTLLFHRRSRVAPGALESVVSLVSDHDPYLGELARGDFGHAARETVLVATALFTDLARGVPAEWAVRRALTTLGAP